MNERAFNLEIATTSTCNMACTYCFEGEELKSKQKQQHQNIEPILQKIDLLLTDQRFNLEYDSICLNFWGGEPTLNYSWNKELIEKTLSNNKIKYFIYSNGYDYLQLKKHIDLFPEEVLHRLRIQISWDGIDNGRVDHKAKATTEKVLATIKTIALVYPELHLTTKATIQPDELLRLQEIWLKYYDLFQEINKTKNNVHVTFSPTLNYVDDHIESEDFITSIHTQFGIIYKLEEKFHAKYNFHLFGWFSETLKDARGKRLTNCSAGINLMAVDYDGTMSACHGTLYSDKKKDFANHIDTNIKDPNQKFLTRFFTSRDELKKSTDYVADGCITCEATVCYKCPVVNIEQLNEFKPENFQVRDTRHCNIYKTFGRFDRALIASKSQALNNSN